jgi:hypothetical protein
MRIVTETPTGPEGPMTMEGGTGLSVEVTTQAEELEV